jgi:gluconolactonase
MDRRSFLTAAGGALTAAVVPARALAQALPLGPLAATRYPDPRIEAVDPRFRARIGNAAIERIPTGYGCSSAVTFVRQASFTLIFFAGFFVL